jgi:hypothetical protein
MISFRAEESHICERVERHAPPYLGPDEFRDPVRGQRYCKGQISLSFNIISNYRCTPPPPVTLALIGANSLWVLCDIQKTKDEEARGFLLANGKKRFGPPARSSS